MPFALRNTYAHFKRNPYCGGLTGELRVERPYRNFLTSVQYMEWKVGAVQCLGGARGRRNAGFHSPPGIHHLTSLCPCGAPPRPLARRRCPTC